MYTIKRVAELTGLGLSTLRAWERRYGVVAPARSDGRYRLYSDADVRALAIMASLVHDGWTASEAATETLARTEGDRRSAIGGAHQSGDVESPAGLEELLAAAQGLDGPAVSAIVAGSLGRAEFAEAASHWLMPTLAAVGGAWAEGRLSAAGEHLISYAVQRQLAGLYEAAPRTTTGPVVVLGLPPGSRHELGLLAFSVAARQAGLTTVYLGADLPSQDWEAAVSGREAGGAVLSVPRPADVVSAQEVVDRLARSASGVVVAIGGRHQDEVTGALQLGHDLATGVALLRDALVRAQRHKPGR
ncbi:probable transcriptional regulator [Janibacter sp. HTCC2649]|uniref:MerR family transcriptional regulator n=1 Tax=Janibacter sp. HTCC2649 TaxID=313589 RepID=UPI0000670B56|nr:MerR family transcriptional regulator [Janibacter sp. HTCC2649]EAQ00886.1 probable transcriptional regulator [Janibacter sp. HTCC2649]